MSIAPGMPQDRGNNCIIHTHCCSSRVYPLRQFIHNVAVDMLTKEGHLSVKPCAFVPAVLNLPEIKRAPRSVSNVSLPSSHRGPGGGVDLTEGCMLTKSVKYTHQLSHFISAIHKGDPQPAVSRKFTRTYPQLLTLHTGGRHCEVVYRSLRQLHS